MRLISDSSIALLLVAAALLGALAGAFTAFHVQKPCEGAREPPATTAASQPLAGIFSVNMVVPAVDNKGEGVATDLRVEVKPGTGEVLANINQLLFFVDTQYSIQTARDVAANFTGMDTRALDIIYSIETPFNITLVGGPSAGAALTIATIAALKHAAPKPDVMITGTIKPDGSIGTVGGVLEKAKAAKARGASVFIVPPGEGTEVQVKPIENCIQRLNIEYCETTYNRTTINIGDSLGLNVMEVSDIREAAGLFGL